MVNGPNTLRPLGQTVDRELSFLKEVVSSLLQLVKEPHTDPVLKVLIVTGCLILADLSLVLVIFLGHVACALSPLHTKIEPFHYALFMGGHLGVLAPLSIFASIKAAPVEQARRLESSLNKIDEARYGR